MTGSAAILVFALNFYFTNTWLNSVQLFNSDLTGTEVTDRLKRQENGKDGGSSSQRKQNSLAEGEREVFAAFFSCVLKNKYQEQQRSKQHGTNAISSHPISNCHDMGTDELRPNKGKEPSGSKERTHTTWLNCEKQNKLKSKPIKFVIEDLWLQKGSGIDILFILGTFLRFVLLFVMKTTTFSLFNYSKKITGIFWMNCLVDSKFFFVFFLFFQYQCKVKGECSYFIIVKASSFPTSEFHHIQQALLYVLLIVNTTANVLLLIYTA